MMKNAISLFFAITLFICSFGQRIAYDQYHRHTYDDYMSKSKRLKTTGWVLLGAGVGMIAGGIVLIATDNNTYNNYNNSLTGQQVTGAILVYAGTLCSLGSIPLLVVGGIMHRKAMKAAAFINMEQVPAEKLTGISLHPFPALGMQINL